MITKPNLTSHNLCTQEIQIEKAVQVIKTSEKPNISEATRDFGVPRGTLRDRLKNIPSRLWTRQYCKKLYPDEEEVLVEEICSMDGRGFAPTQSDVSDLANLILAHRGNMSSDRVGHNWVTNFVKRQEKLRSIFSKGLSYKRASCEDPEMSRSWLDLVEYKIAHFGIDPHDIYNFDETGFAMGMAPTKKVVADSKRKGRRARISAGNRNWVTAIECINASGWVLPPCIIFKGKTYDPNWATCGPSDWLFEVSDNGWTDNRVTLNWLKDVFLVNTESKRHGKYRLLIFDGHVSHLTSGFLKECDKNNIVTLCMPSNSSNHLQPLDATCFSPLKNKYGDQISGMSSAGIENIDKFDFIMAYESAREHAFKPSTIISGFRVSGLTPIDPNPVIAKLNLDHKPITPPSTPQRNWTPKTPTNSVEASNQEQSILNLVADEAGHVKTPVKIQLRQLCKGTKKALNRTEFYAKAQEEKDHAIHILQKKQGLKRKRVRESAQSLSKKNQKKDEVAKNSSIETNHPQMSHREKSSKKKPRRCGICRMPGHRKETCKNK